MSSPAGRWPLRFLSLAISVVLWLVLSYNVREQALLERALDNVTVSYNTPEGFILLNPVSTILVRVSGAEELIRELSQFEVSAIVDLEARIGIQEIVLDQGELTRPQGVTIDAITPDRLSLELDREIEKVLAVDVVTSGEPAAGAIEGEHGVFPSQVTVIGPAGLLERRDRILARVDISGRAKSFEQEVTLETGDPLVHVQGSSTSRVQIVLETPLLSSEAVDGANGASDEPVS